MISLLVLSNLILAGAVAYLFWFVRGKVILNPEEALLLSSAMDQMVQTSSIGAKNTQVLLGEVLTHQRDIAALKKDLKHLAGAVQLKEEAVC